MKMKWVGAAVVAGILVMAAASELKAQSSFTPVEQWRKAVLAGDSGALMALYDGNAQISLGANKAASVAEEVAYWKGWKQQGLTGVSTEIQEQREPQPGIHTEMIEVTLTVNTGGAAKKMYIAMAQSWMRQGGAWKIVQIQRRDAQRLPQPIKTKDIYPADANAKEEIANALKTAAKSGKRVLLVFGGNWCYDCHVLDEAFHSAEIAPTLNRNYVVVHVDIGEYDKNLDVAERYGVPLKKGVPAAAVLASDGKPLFSQKNGEFEKARSMAPEDILAFLNKWKPRAKAS
jgi:ketosteroid isomerase-like protein